MKACALKEFPEGAQKVALFHFNKEITAIGNACLHKAGPLGLGAI